MKRFDPTFVLLAGDADWRIAVASATGVRMLDLDVDADAGHASPSRLATAIERVLRANHYAGGPLTLAVPSSWCFPATISVQGVTTTDARALAYRLEEALPFAAETVVSDFIVTGDRALGVCIKPDDLAPTLDALAAAGVDVAVVTPAAVLVAQGCVPSGASVLLLPEPTSLRETLSIFSMRDGRPAQWATVPATSEDVGAQMRLMASESPAEVGFTSDVAIAVDHAADVSVTSLQAIASSATAIAAGRVQPLLNFRRDALAVADPIRRHRRPLNALLAAAAILLLAITCATFIRSTRYREAERSAEAQMRTEFLAQFPDWSGPINVAVVDSERRKVLAAASGVQRTIARPSALKTLSDVLSHLPTTAAADVRVSRMSFGESSFELEGRVAASEQLDALVTAAREAGLNVTPPQTRKDADNSWSFVLRGAKPADAAAVAEGGLR